MSLPLYLPQRPLSCCFDHKDFLAHFDPKGFLAVGLARGKKWQRAGNTGKGKERREAPPFPSSYHSPRTLPNPILFKNFPWGASAEEGVPTPLISTVPNFKASGSASSGIWYENVITVSNCKYILVGPLNTRSIRSISVYLNYFLYIN